MVGRKNYYGSGSRWSARLAAVLFPILQSLELWQINPQRWLSCYLQSCSRIGQPGTAAIEEIPALGHRSRPKSGLRSTLWPGGGME